MLLNQKSKVNSYKLIVEKHFETASLLKEGERQSVSDEYHCFEDYENGFQGMNTPLGFPLMLKNTSQELLLMVNHMDFHARDMPLWEDWCRANPEAKVKIVMDGRNVAPNTITSKFLDASFPNVEIRDHAYDMGISLAVSDQVSVYLQKNFPYKYDAKVVSFGPNVARLSILKFDQYWAKSKKLVI